MPRLLALLVALAVPAASAQTYYNSLDGPDRPEAERGAPGVRVGVGVGPSVYLGPDLLFGEAAFQSDVLATRLGVVAELTAPLVGDRLYGRLGAGLLNLGTDGDRPDVPSPRDNPFLTAPIALAEGDLLYYLRAPGGALAPYLFTGVAALIATRPARGDVGQAALAVPVGVGVEVGLGRNLGLFAEASYRFGLTSVGEEATIFPTVAPAALAPATDDVDCSDPDNKKDPKCTSPPPCDADPTQPGCEGVIGDSDSAFDTRFDTALLLGGLRLGFGRAPAPAVIPPARPIPAPRPAPVLEPEPAPAVCDLVELNTVTFGTGRDVLDRRARMLLDENVALLLESPACCVFVDGYTDTAEADRFGLALSERRALAVVDYYVSRGVEADRLEARTLGRAVPSCDKEDPGPGCERNRRVESLPLDCERFLFLLENPDYDPR